MFDKTHNSEKVLLWNSLLSGSFFFLASLSYGRLFPSRHTVRRPTNKQLAYIDILLEEREANQVAFRKPQSIEEASALISALKKLFPYREEEENEFRRPLHV